MVHKNRYNKSSITTEDFLNYYSHVSQLTGDQCNDVCLLAFVAGSQSSNPSILSHDQAMTSIYRDKFEISMADDLDMMFENEINELI
jgi:hypothetical protein